MAASDSSTRRVIAVITLMTLAAWALRGYLPGVEPALDRPPPRSDNPAALLAVLALLCTAVAVIGFAIIARMRDRRPRRGSAGGLPRGAATIGKPTWRFALIALAAIVAWLLLIMLLSRVLAPGPADQPSAVPSATPDTSTPAAGDDVEPPRPDDDTGTDTNVVNYLIPPMLVLMTIIVVGTAVASRRRRRDPSVRAVADDRPVPASAPAAASSLARAAEIGLAEMVDLSREPREAIIACYAAMERELTRVPGAAPQDYDTPTEVLARAVDSGALRADSAIELVELFEEARFSPHVMTEAHRDSAAQVLRRVLDELPRREVAA